MASPSMRNFASAIKQQSGNSVVIVGGKRTAVGVFAGQLSGMSAPMLGSTAARGAIEQAGIQPNDIEENYFGCVITAGLGQAPDRQVALKSGCSIDTPSTLVNKVCSSGLKAVMQGAQQIRLGDRQIVLAGGMESMSKAPHLFNLRKPTGYGHAIAYDTITSDGFTDVYNNILMGSCVEKNVSEMGISREAQDEYAIMSYQRARKAQENGWFRNEIQNISIMDRKGVEKVISEDEECKKFMPDKFPGLNPAFQKEGTITAANASKINDGAAAFILMSEDAAKERGLKPLARIIGYDDAGIDPLDFALAPAKAADRLLNRLGLEMSDIDFHEINEAFSAVALANIKLMDLDIGKVNVHGGAVALGHPIGASGARILLSLLTVLQRQDGTLGMASICNGGGGGSAMVVERMN